MLGALARLARKFTGTEPPKNLTANSLRRGRELLSATRIEENLTHLSLNLSEEEESLEESALRRIKTWRVKKEQEI